MEWARLLRQVFAVDVLRCPCGGQRKVIAALTRNHSPEALRRYLEHIGEAVDPPPSSPARAPQQPQLFFGAPVDADTGAYVIGIGTKPEGSESFPPQLP